MLLQEVIIFRLHGLRHILREPKTQKDMDKLSNGLAKLAEATM